MFNATITGRITRNAELSKSPSNNSVSTFTIVVNEFYGGEQHQEYLSMELWGERAEKLHDSLSKGQLIDVTASIRTREYTDTNKVKRYRTNFYVHRLEFIGSKVNRIEDAATEETETDASNDEWVADYDRTIVATTPVEAAKTYLDRKKG